MIWTQHWKTHLQNTFFNFLSLFCAVGFKDFFNREKYQKVQNLTLISNALKKFKKKCTQKVSKQTNLMNISKSELLLMFIKFVLVHFFRLFYGFEISVEICVFLYFSCFFLAIFFGNHIFFTFAHTETIAHNTLCAWFVWREWFLIEKTTSL